MDGWSEGNGYWENVGKSGKDYSPSSNIIFNGTLENALLSLL